MIVSLIAYSSPASENRKYLQPALSSGCRFASYALLPTYSTDSGPEPEILNMFRTLKHYPTMLIYAASVLATQPIDGGMRGDPELN